jgi:hypothetical protein
MTIHMGTALLVSLPFDLRRKPFAILRYLACLQTAGDGG